MSTNLTRGYGLTISTVPVITRAGDTILATADSTTHNLTGAVVGSGAVVVGATSRVSGPVTHVLTGSVVGSGSIVSGSTSRAGTAVSMMAFNSRGFGLAITTDADYLTRLGPEIGSTPITGQVTHNLTGAVVGAGAVVSGVTARVGPVVHNLTGAVAGSGATVSGSLTISVLAETIVANTATGDNGPGLLYSIAQQPANAGKYLNYVLTTTPSSGTWSWNADGSFTETGAASGVYTIGFDWYANGVYGGADTSDATVYDHDLTGAVVGSGSIVSGATSRSGGSPNTHVLTGAIVGSGAVVSGTTSINRVHDLSGAVVGSGSVVRGEVSGPNYRSGGDSAAHPGWNKKAWQERKTKSDAITETISAEYARITQTPVQAPVPAGEPKAPAVVYKEPAKPIVRDNVSIDNHSESLLQYARLGIDALVERDKQAELDDEEAILLLM